MAETDKVCIYVNQSAITENRTAGTSHPPIVIARPTQSDLCHGVEIHDHVGNVVAIVRYEPEDTLEHSGASVWIELADWATAVQVCDPTYVEQAA